MKIWRDFNKHERRKTPRTPICMHVEAECDSWMNLCFSKDISESGIFLISEKLPSLGVDFSLKVYMPADLPVLRVRAQVVRIQDHTPRGFALTWTELPEKEKKQLDILIKRWESVFPTS